MSKEYDNRDNLQGGKDEKLSYKGGERQYTHLRTVAEKCGISNWIKCSDRIVKAA